MKKISPSTFCSNYKVLIGRRKIEDRHYYHGDEKNQRMLYKTIRKGDTWTVILYGNSSAPATNYRSMPAPFRRLPNT